MSKFDELKPGELIAVLWKVRQNYELELIEAERKGDVLPPRYDYLRNSPFYDCRPLQVMKQGRNWSSFAVMR